MIGAIFGMLVILVVYVVAEALASLADIFGGSVEDMESVDVHVGISVVLYIIAIIVSIAVKPAKIVGVALLGLAVATLISAGGFGIISFAVLIAAGLVGLRWKDKARSNESALDVLNGRYARGEITEGDYKRIKEDMSK